MLTLADRVRERKTEVLYEMTIYENTDTNRKLPEWECEASGMEL